MGGENFEQVLLPHFKSASALIEIGIPVIDRGNTADRTVLVIEDGIGNVRVNSKPRHAGRRRPAQVVVSPARHRLGVVISCLSNR